MPKYACAACAAARILCANCAVARTPFDQLPVWPDAAHAMLPGTRQMMAGGDDDEEGEEEEEADEKPSGKKGKGDDDDDDGEGDGDDGKGKSKAKGKAKGKGKSGAGAAASGGGMGLGMILGIVFVLLTCCICLPGVGVGIVMLGGVRGAAGQVQSMNNAKQIGLALHNYHNAMQSLPSPRSDKADLSWRVAMLPYLEELTLNQQFDQNAGWDKGKNQPLVNNRPMMFDSPMHPPADKTQTPWQYFTGPNTIFPDPKTKVRFADVTDGLGNTFLFAEAGTPVPWSKPADMAVPASGALPLPQGTFIAVLGDSTARVIDRSKVNDDTLRLVINPKDGKPLPPGTLD